ncbi:MAG: WD40 repeat domain-containing protein [Candidatus Marinimicrobia bacterium]|nr:WD40 repeat domain-containing protein [Candidatus Neomarinimicrobiota bacterium]
MLKNKIILLVFAFTLPLFAGELMYNDMFVMEQLKDSLIAANWEHRTEFPYFKKTAPTGSSPKSCTFSPDGKYIYVTLLGQRHVAVQIYSVNPFEKIKTIYPGCDDPANDYGYAEGVFRERDGKFWFTRMTTSEYFIYDPKSDSLQAGRYTGGDWTKSLEFSPNQEQIAMSHWVSNRISIFDVDRQRIIRNLKTSQIPRGLAWIGNDTLAVTLYGGANSTDCGIEVFDVRTGKKVETILEYRSAMRDVRYDPLKKMLYYDDMRFALVYKYDWIKRETVATEEVDSHPNTIRLTPDGKYLFVSCRGPNNPNGYTLPSPRNADIVVIDTESMTTLTSWAQGNQPTGLDISQDGCYLATTDFMDKNVNLYVISDPRKIEKKDVDSFSMLLNRLGNIYEMGTRSFWWWW